MELQINMKQYKIVYEYRDRTEVQMVVEATSQFDAAIKAAVKCPTGCKIKKVISESWVCPVYYVDFKNKKLINKIEK